MKKSDELKKIIDELKARADQLQQEEQYDEAMKVADELKDAVREFKFAKTMEEAEATNFMTAATPAGAKSTISDAAMRNRIFNKCLFGRSLNDEEMAYLNQVGTPGQAEGTAAKGGYLVPEEQINQLLELRRAYTQLKSFTNVQVALSNAGKQPTVGAETGTLIAFDELNEIHQGDIDFSQLAYEIADYGDIIPVSNTLLQDVDLNLMGIIGQRFARKAVNTENAQILAKLAAITDSPTAISTYKGITKALNVSLDPAFYANAKIFTNQDGFEWMSELEDAQNRPLLVPDVAAPDTYRFRGKEVVVISNSILETSETGTGTVTRKAPMYIGSMSDFLAFFERTGVEVAVSDQAGFTKNATLIRAIERFDTVVADSAAMKSYQVTL